MPRFLTLAFLLASASALAEPAPLEAPAEQAEAPAEQAEALTADRVHALIDAADRIEAKNGAGEKREWSKDLTPADVATLKKGLGQGTLSPGAPRCAPVVNVTVFHGDKAVLGLGAFCEKKGPIAVHLGQVGFAMEPADHEALNEALAAPTDK